MNTGNYEIRRLGPDNLSLAQHLFAILREVFAEAPARAGDAHIGKLLENPAIVVLAAFFEGEIVGGLTAYVLPMYYADVAELYIYDIAVKPAFQRKGVGKKLLDGIRTYCRGAGINTIFVDANEVDQDALDFYRGTGASAEKVVQFTYLSIQTKGS